MKTDKTNSPFVPVFGIEKLLSSFKITDKDWDELKKYSKLKDEQKCKELCEKNYFLKPYSNFLNIKEKNKTEAEKYLDGLKWRAFFSGIIPGLDIGMEYFYKYKFKNKLEILYGFNYDKAKENCKEKLEKKS